jgi:hypothetical protein
MTMNAASAHRIATMAMNGSPGFTGALGLAPAVQSSTVANRREPAPWVGVPSSGWAEGYIDGG